MIEKPMLAGKVEMADLAGLTYPIAVTPKLDGIRCIKQKRALSRTFKDIPNQHIQTLVSKLPANGLDGELMVGKTFQDVSSGVMSPDGEPDFQYWVFDYVLNDPNKPYMARMRDLKALKLPKWCKKVLPVVVENKAQLVKEYERLLKEGYEGAMLRSLDGGYKFGRSSLKQGGLLKLKPLEDSEARIIGFEELQHNENEAQKDNFGRTKRSSSKEGKVGAGTLGKFLVEEIGDTPWKNKEFAIGTGQGLTHELRQAVWDSQDKYVGLVVKYTYQAIGSKDLPRIPIFVGFRDDRDLDA